MYKKPTIRDVMEMANFMGVSERTARRYLQNPACMPDPERMLWDLHCNGRIVPESWPGIRFHGERLVTDTEYTLAYGQVQQYAWHIDCLQLLLRDLARLGQRVKEIEESPRQQLRKRDREALEKLQAVEQQMENGLPDLVRPAPTRHREYGC
ncbi:hypothetical protein [uncultured Microbulbifer sp.]|uniref:hypothetical protein n=1 Tax=uncultured Microbulbifer sp. TaxID=348147 RepID=UPI002627E75F|nr:hypothetical protein [uncultured Microbulbifer sp.]